MAFDFQKYATELGMSADDQQMLSGLFGRYDGMAAKIDGFIDTEVQTRISPLQADLTRKNAEIDGMLSTLANARDTDTSVNARLERDLERAVAERAILETRFRTVASDAGMNADDLLKDLRSEPVVTKPAAGTFDAAAINQEINRTGVTAVRFAAQASDLARELSDLTKKQVSSLELIDLYQDRVRKTQNPNLDLRVVAEEHFKIPELRTTQLRDSIRAEEQARAQQSIQAVRDEYALKGVTLAGTAPQQTFTPSTPITAALAKDAKPVVVGGVPDAVQAAVADYGRRLAARTAA